MSKRYGAVEQGQRGPVQTRQEEQHETRRDDHQGERLYGPAAVQQRLEEPRRAGAEVEAGIPGALDLEVPVQ
ncbi:hypothetical protein [Streptomyces olivaceoviridis]|uniref:hypothetical protein n=1 Tax=Streptomyces olivaceoviridis TaxID=1921 RepID=UPI00167B5814|nr:hypothetical protein [Streptomyces olivaceoviridis]